MIDSTCIEILLRMYRNNCDPFDVDLDDQERAGYAVYLHRLGLIDEQIDTLKLTQRGEVYVDALLELELPEVDHVLVREQGGVFGMTG